jgi:hypothetical protein
MSGRVLLKCHAENACDLRIDMCSRMCAATGSGNWSDRNVFNSFIVYP